MTMPSSFRRASLALAIIAAVSASGGAVARELENFDITVANRKPGSTTVAGKQSAIAQSARDALGRETFTWVQQDLPADAKANAGSPESAARAHLALLLGAAKRGGDVAQTLSLRKVDRQQGGATLVHFQPRIDGIVVFREDLALLLDRDQRLVAMRGPLPQTPASAAKSLSRFELDAPQAIAAALRDYDFPAEVAERLTATAGNGDYQHFTLDPQARSKSGAVGSGEQRARRVYFRTRAGLQPAWYVETRVADGAGTSSDAYAQVISAVDGSLLFRINQTAHAEPFSYRVWAEGGSDRLPYPSPQGRNAVPDPDGLPSNNSVALIAQDLRSLANAPFSQAATDGWLPPGATVTNGNNAVAYADLAEPDGFGAGDLQPTVTSPGTFDFTFNPNLPPAADATQTNAATLQMFYWVNWLHDWFYDSGFAESDGNAQVDNFGRGGVSGDAIRAEAQDASTPNNANMSTPSDGGSPRMQMGLTSGPPERDNTVDGHTLAHEWGHYMTNRLVGDASGLDTENAGGMGEGWGDFIALLSSVKDEDRLKPGNASFNGAYGFSGYSDNQTYYGVRRYTYSTDLAKNPLTLRHIVNGNALPAQPAPNFGATGANNAEVHNQGEVWASALWDCYASLLNDRSRLSFAEAQQRMKAYLVGGLKLTPVSPTMIEARDAILATVLANGDAADYALFTAAFAKRGLGAGALIPDRYSTTMLGTVESTSVGGDLAVTAVSAGLPIGCDADAVLDAGETAEVSVTVRNTGFTALEGASAILSSSNPALSFPEGNSVAIGSLPLGASKSVNVTVALDASSATNAPITLSVSPTAPGIVEPPGYSGSLQLFVNFDEAERSSASEAFDSNQTNWQNRRDPAGAGEGAWSNRAEEGLKFLHGADTASAAVSWIETPVMSVGSAPLVLTINDRYSFEYQPGGRIPTAYDGGLIQASIDGGVTWSDIDPLAAGYPTTLLSRCCDNPLAGQRVYSGNSPFYPQFVDRTINLQTAYANQANFRLRFGVATDAAVSQHGWDINTVSISGLNDTPFNAVVPQSSTCSVTTDKTLQGALSGTYYDPSRSGEGVLVDFGEIGGTPVVFLSWYTYDDGQQQWLVGSSPFSLADTAVQVPLIATSGARFGDEFRSEDVVSSDWGSAALAFPDCEHMRLTYQKAGGESGTLTLQRGLERLQPAQCGTLHGGLSGTYYSTERSGEGVLIDLGKVGATPVEFFAWYTYDQGEQQWLVGSAPFASGDQSISAELIRTQGANFGTGFRSEDVVSTPWGSVTQRFIDCETLELSYQKAGGETGTMLLSRGLNQLGDGQCR